MILSQKNSAYGDSNFAYTLDRTPPLLFFAGRKLRLPGIEIKASSFVDA